MERAIEDHGVIGDLATVALVGTDATIDYMCWPRADSPSVFASILDEERGGAFTIRPELDDVRLKQMYMPDTNVLLTRFLATGGVAEVSDFMIVQGRGDGQAQRLVRRAKAVRGTVRFAVRCAPRFDYARAMPEVEIEDGAATMTGGGLALRLRAAIALEAADDAVTAEFELEHGQSAWFILDDADAPPVDDPERFVADAFKETCDFWRGWTAQSNYDGRWRDYVSRSALALKLLTSAEHGSILAAGTFGLPEEVGGERNWDYRYTWIRDAAFTVYGFIRVGHTAEADAFMRWLGSSVAPAMDSGKLPLLFRLDGSRDLDETELDQLSGYRGSAPVRIGNEAAGQLQLDIYGELLDAIYLADKYGERITYEAWNHVCRGLTWLADHWHEPDEGIWEIRGGRREFLHSRLMCWVAFDRAVRLMRKRSLPGPHDEWRSIRDTIHDDIHENFFDAGKGAFVQSKGSKHLDAACLLMPLVRFIAPTDPRWLSTLLAVGEELTEDSLVYRYHAENSDGLEGEEGTFNMCSFWYIECLCLSGDVEQARYLFEKMLGYSNHLGLFAEETGAAGEQLGNFPQAFTHLALISAAYALDRAMKGEGRG